MNVGGKVRTENKINFFHQEHLYWKTSISKNITLTATKLKMVIFRIFLKNFGREGHKP